MKSFLIGLGLGVGLGILFAPMSGEETRNNLSDRANDLASSARETYEQNRDRVQRGVQSIRGTAERAMGKVRSATRDYPRVRKAIRLAAFRFASRNCPPRQTGISSAFLSCAAWTVLLGAGANSINDPRFRLFCSLLIASAERNSSCKYWKTGTPRALPFIWTTSASSNVY